MRAPLSVIVPTLNSASTLPSTAYGLKEGLENELVRELVICDGGSRDATRELAFELGAEFISAEPGRGTQLDAGAKEAHGDWLLFVHADTRLEAGWSAAVLQHISNQSGTAAYFRLRFRESGFWPAWTAWWANFRSNHLDLPYGDQCLLIHRRLYDDVGGFPHVPLMEDVIIARKLKGRLRMLGAVAITDGSRYVDEGWFLRGTKNLTLLVRFLSGESPDRLARNYKRR